MLHQIYDIGYYSSLLFLASGTHTCIYLHLTAHTFSQSTRFFSHSKILGISPLFGKRSNRKIDHDESGDPKRE